MLLKITDNPRQKFQLSWSVEWGSTNTTVHMLSAYTPCKQQWVLILQSFTISRTEYGWHHMQLYINSWWIVLLRQCIGHVDVHFHPPHTTRNRVPTLAILWLITQIQTKICENLSTSKMLSCVHPNLDSVHSTSQTRQPKNQNLKAYSNLRYYLHSMYTSVLSPVPKCIKSNMSETIPGGFVKVLKFWNLQ